jgi:hypothetical protein
VSDGREQLPERLRRAIEKDLEPVRPLRTPGIRALVVVLWGVALLVTLPAILGIRGDAEVLGFMLSWGVSVLETAAGLGLVWLALREAVPGRGGTAAGRVAALAAALAILAGTAVLTWARVPTMKPIEDATLHGVECFSMESVFGVPALILTLWLVVRAFPVRPVWAGILGGAGAGMLADGVQHLLCGIPDLHHVMVWHGGAALTLAVLGGAVGWLWQRRQVRRLGG